MHSGAGAYLAQQLLLCCEREAQVLHLLSRACLHCKQVAVQRCIQAGHIIQARPASLKTKQQGAGGSEASGWYKLVG